MPEVNRFTLNETPGELVAREGYRDEDGNPVALEALVVKSPMWAVNRIRIMQLELAELRNNLK